MTTSTTDTTQVVIIGAGPSGLLLAWQLAAANIESIILERQTCEHVLSRVRAGVLEQGTVETLTDSGLGDRLHAEGLVHDGFTMIVGDTTHRIDLRALTGKAVTVYGQTEITKDLVEKHNQLGTQIHYGVTDVQPTELDSSHPVVHFTGPDGPSSIRCDFVAGCDGYHGVCRTCIPSSILKTYERVYPFGWLGVLSQTPPISDELVYASHDNGFALCSMRSTSRSRYYIQCASDEKIENWSDDRFWNELSTRIGEAAAASLVTGPSIEKSIAPLRSFVAEPMRYKRMFLAGDAAHIVPPTGAKGLNLALADVKRLARAFTTWYTDNEASGLDHYSAECLHRVWKVERFSWWMSMMLHRFPEHTDFERRLQRAEFDYLKDSQTGSAMLAENYVGLPLD